MSFLSIYIYIYILKNIYIYIYICVYVLTREECLRTLLTFRALPLFRILKRIFKSFEKKGRARNFSKVFKRFLFMKSFGSVK